MTHPDEQQQQTVIPEESVDISHARWEQAACGRHSNRYCEDDHVWDATCHYCANNYAHLKSRDERIAKLETENTALRAQLAVRSGPVTDEERRDYTLDGREKEIIERLIAARAERK